MASFDAAPPRQATESRSIVALLVGELRLVEIHREFITAAARWMMAAKL